MIEHDKTGFSSTEKTGDKLGGGGFKFLKPIPVTGSVFLGMGFAPRINQAKNRVVEDSSIQKMNPSNKPEYVFDYAENYSEMARLLNISASASYGAAGASGGSASISIMQSTYMMSSRAYVVLKMRVMTKENTIETANLTDAALGILKEQTQVQFYEKYGSQFIRTLYHGGELACVMEFTSAVDQSSESFRAEVKAQVGLAKGEASMESSVITLTKSRRVRITYAQVGGTLGQPGTGIFTATPEELIQRIRDFPFEVRGTDGLDGSSVPLSAEMSSLRDTENWPPDHDEDLENPYPPAIDHIAGSIRLLQEKLAVAEGILNSTMMQAPSSVQTAKETKPYLEFQISESIRELNAMMTNALIKPTRAIETFLEYRIRNHLGVSSDAIRNNVGPGCELAEPDKHLVESRLFGKEDMLAIAPWPQLEILGPWWGYQGQEPGRLPGVHVICPQHGGSIQKTAEQLTGKQNANDGIFAFADPYVQAAVGDGACGYTIIHFNGIKVIKPDSPKLPALPTLPIKPATNIPVIQDQPVESGSNRWSLTFTLTMPCATSCGRYSIIITWALKSDNSKTWQATEQSYWYKENEQNLLLTHPIVSDEGHVIKSFLVKVDAAFCDK